MGSFDERRYEQRLDTLLAEIEERMWASEYVQIPESCFPQIRGAIVSFIKMVVDQTTEKLYEDLCSANEAEGAASHQYMIAQNKLDKIRSIL